MSNLLWRKSAHAIFVLLNVMISIFLNLNILPIRLKSSFYVDISKFEIQTTDV